MKTHVSIGLLLLLATACAGSRAREHALWPQVASTWPAVRESIMVALGEVGREDNVCPDCGHTWPRTSFPPPQVHSKTNAVISKIDAAVAADDHELLRGVEWSFVEPIARWGVQVRVDRGEISEGVAVSLFERIAVFSEAIQELAGT